MSKGETARQCLENWREIARSFNVRDSIRQDSIMRVMDSKWKMATQHDTMYYMFSTAAQVVAAVVGLLLMCAIFKREQMGCNDNSTRKWVHWVSSLAMLVAAIAIVYDLWMIYNVPSELISPSSFVFFIILNISPILMASYSVWAYLK